MYFLRRYRCCKRRREHYCGNFQLIYGIGFLVYRTVMAVYGERSNCQLRFYWCRRSLNWIKYGRQDLSYLAYIKRNCVFWGKFSFSKFVNYLAGFRGNAKVINKLGFVIFFCIQSQIAVPLQRMRTMTSTTNTCWNNNCWFLKAVVAQRQQEYFNG